MSAFTVTVCTATHRYRFSAVGTDSFSVFDDAFDQFPEQHSIVVIPQQVPHE